MLVECHSDIMKLFLSVIVYKYMVRVSEGGESLGAMVGVAAIRLEVKGLSRGISLLQM